MASARSAAIALVVLAAWGTAAAASPVAREDPRPSACIPGPASQVVVRAWLGPADAVLEDGRIVRLADILLPAPASGGDAQDGARALGHPVGAAELWATWPEPDRLGRIRGHLVFPGGRQRAGGPPNGSKPGGGAPGEGGNPEGHWLQAALVARGEAIVKPDAMASPCVYPLLAFEAEARTGRRGAWSDAALHLDAEDPDLDRQRGSYAAVTGKVASDGSSARNIYLNFGSDYRQDFTVIIGIEDRKTWYEQAPSAEALVGRRVRVRGVLEAWNGGLIRVEHPAQIELLGDR